MARRILYNPADFIEASTPFYENIVGMITDQTRRMERNIAKREEAQALAEAREFKLNTIEQSQEFQAEQAEKQRDAVQGRHDDMMAYRYDSLRAGMLSEQYGQWARNRKSRIQAAFDARTEEAEKRQEKVDAMLKSMRESGLFGDDTPVMISVGYSEEKGGWTVEDPTLSNEGVRYDDWVNRYRTLYDLSNFIDQQNIYQWSRSNLYDAREGFSGSGMVDEEGNRQVFEDKLVVDPLTAGEDGQGNVYYGRDAFLELVKAVQNELPNAEQAAQRLEQIMRSDAKYKLLFKDNEMAQALDFDSVAATVNTVRSTFSDATGLQGLIFDEDGLLTDNAGKVFPAILPLNGLTQIPLGKASEKLRNFKTEFILNKKGTDVDVDGNKEIYEQMTNSVDAIKKLVLEIIQAYGDDPAVVPESLQHHNPVFLMRKAMINSEEFKKDFPNVRNLITFGGKEREQKLAQMDSNDLEEQFDNAYEQERAKQRAMNELIYGNPKGFNNPDPTVDDGF